MPVKQVMVKQVRDYRAEGCKELISVYWEELVKLKAAESSRFFSKISAKIFNIGRILNFKLVLCVKLTASCDGC